jgi:hypothetical protein
VKYPVLLVEEVKKPKNDLIKKLVRKAFLKKIIIMG